MSLSTIAGDSAGLAALQQRRNALKTLESDVESGNFSAAQADVAAFQQMTQSLAASGGQSAAATTASAAASVSGLQSDLTSLLNAALGGNSSALQTSATAVQNDLQDFGVLGGQASSNPLATALDSLLGAAQSGDVSGARQAAQTLIQDAQASSGPGAAGAHHGHHHGGGGDSDDLNPTTDQLIDPTDATSPTQSAGGLPQALLDALDEIRRPVRQTAPQAGRHKPMSDATDGGCRPRMREASDDEALMALFNEECFQRFATHMNPFTGVDEMRAWLACLGADRFEIVCECGGELAGFAGLYILADRQSHIGWFFLGVREKFQRRGVGAMLMSMLLGVSRFLAGLRGLQLTVFADNAPAIRLYRRFGFEVEGRHRDFLRREDGPVDAFTMARRTVRQRRPRQGQRRKRMNATASSSKRRRGASASCRSPVLSPVASSPSSRRAKASASATVSGFPFRLARGCLYAHLCPAHRGDWLARDRWRNRARRSHGSYASAVLQGRLTDGLTPESRMKRPA